MPEKKQGGARMAYEEGVVFPWQGDWKIDLSDWTTMEPILQWQEMAHRSDFKGLNAQMATVIRSWPHEVDPSDVASYAKLSPGQWKVAVTKVGEAVGAFFQGAVD